MLFAIGINKFTVNNWEEKKPKLLELIKLSDDDVAFLDAKECKTDYFKYNTRPPYFDEFCNIMAEELDEIVRVAVLTQPDAADSIVQTLSQEHPNKIVEIMTSALNAVPFVGEYVVDALLAVFPNEAQTVVETAVRESSHQREQVIRILSTAQHAGVSQDKLKEYAMSAGLSEEDFNSAVSN